MNNKSGFTLIEVLIAMVVSLVIMGGAYMFFNSQQRQTTTQTNISDAQQTLRAAMDFISRDVRMAGYNPTESTTFFGVSNIADVNGMSAIRFTWDDPDGTPTSNYFISTLNGSAVAPNSRALMYDDGTGVQPLAGYIIALGLAYAYDTDDDGELDQNGAGEIIWGINNGGNWDSLTVDQAAGTATTTATGTPVDLRDIRAIRIWMLSQSQAPDPNFLDTKTYVVGPHLNTPATRVDNRFRHRLLERTILCRNMGL